MQATETSSAQAQAHADQLGLEGGHLKSPQLVSLAVASFIPAVGMSFAPLLFFTSAGTKAWSAALLAMAVTVCVGLSVITFARRYVASGSLFSYVAEVFGPWARYITAAALLMGFVMQLGATGNLVGIYLGSVLEQAGVEGAFNGNVQALVLAVTMGIVGIIAVRGLDASRRVVVTSALVTVPIMLVISIGSASATGLHLADQFTMSGFDGNGVFQGMAAGVSFLVAFESCSALASETRNPKRSVPLAIMAVPVVLGLLYLVTTVLQEPGLAATEEARAGGASPVSALATLAGMPAWVGSTADLLIGLVVFTGLLGFVNFGSRYLVTLGEVGYLPKAVTSVNRRRSSPVVAIVVLLVLAYLFIFGMILFTGDLNSAYNVIARAVVVCWVPMYLLITVGAVILMIRNRDVRPIALIASAAGFLGVLFLYVDGLVAPPPAPAGQMNWAIPLAIALMAGAFAVAVRRDAKRGEPA
jgi:amino acid transporter